MYFFILKKETPVSLDSGVDLAPVKFNKSISNNLFYMMIIPFIYFVGSVKRLC